MQINALQPKTDASRVPLESLAGSKSLSQDQKIAEASRQFEAVLLRQFLSEAQKPVITSEFTDNSTASGIYQDLITNQLADNLSRTGGIGLAQTFERQLSPHASPHGGATKSSGTAPTIGTAQNAGSSKISHP